MVTKWLTAIQVAKNPKMGRSTVLKFARRKRENDERKRTSRMDNDGGDNSHGLSEPAGRETRPRR
jgi:hypothetical protein